MKKHYLKYLILIPFLLLLIPANARALDCFADNFDRPDGTPGANWNVSSSSGGFGNPVIVNGRLRLTDASGNVATVATLNRIFPGAGNMITVEFEHFAYGGTGADGIAVTLSDSAVAPVPGGYGGSLGYAQRTGINGFAGGWLGVGIDEYGNFSNPTEGRVGGPGFRVDSVSIRGSGAGAGATYGAGLPNYAYHAGTNTLVPQVDNNGAAVPPHRYRIIIDHRNGINAWVSVERDTGAGWVMLVAPYDAKAQAGQAAVPTNWWLSYTGSTGGATNIHEIDSLSVCTEQPILPPGGATPGTFTVAVPASLVTMGDNIGEITSVVTNTSTTASDYIDCVTFKLNNNNSPNDGYFVEQDIIAPANWTAYYSNPFSPPNVTNCWGQNMTNNEVTFRTTTAAARIQPSNGTKTFFIRTKGKDFNRIHRANSDSTDTFSTVLAAGTNTFNLSGGLPTWTRRSLSVTPLAFPDAVGIGQSFTLQVLVENRASQAQNGITASPAPTPYLYSLTSLTGDHTATITTMTVTSTTYFPTSGTIKIDSEEITYTGKTATTFTGCTRGANGTTATAHNGLVNVFNKTATAIVTLTGGPVYDPSPLNLSAGGHGFMTYTYRADAEGTVYFMAGAATAGATSRTESSNSVVITPLAVSQTLTPLTVKSGDNAAPIEISKNTGRVTTLSAAIGAADDTVDVASTAGFPQSATIIIENEEIAYTGISGNSFTGCIRGFNGTTAANHSINTPARSTISLGYLVPTITSLPATGVTSTLTAGPLPVSIPSLYPGGYSPGGVYTPPESGAIQWTYNITGTAQQKAYRFQDSSTANNTAAPAVTSNTYQTVWGDMNTYTLSLTPDNELTGNTRAFNFQIFNTSAANDIRYIDIFFPDSNSPAWTYSSTGAVTCSDGNNSWTSSAITNGRRFTATNAGSRINNGQNCTFPITFTVPSGLISDTLYGFNVHLYDADDDTLGENPDFLDALQGYVTVRYYTLDLTPNAPAAVNADGTITTAFTANLTAGGSPVSGRTIIFTGTAGTLSSATDVTDGSGNARMTLTAPASTANINSTVTATFFKAKDSSPITFNGVAAANVQYIGGTLTSCTLPTICLVECKDCSYTFSMYVRNYGSANITLNTTSYFRFTDGTNTFTAYLNAATTVNAGATVALSFGSPTNGGGGGGVAVASAFAYGSWKPTMNLNGTTRNISDRVIIGACACTVNTGKKRIIRWREVVQ